MKKHLGKFLAVCSSGMKRCRPLLALPKKGFLIRAAALVVGVIAVISMGVGALIYSGSSRGAFVNFWAKGIPYPAALVRYEVIAYSDYATDLSALKHFYKQQELTAGMPIPEESVLEKTVMDRLIRNVAVRRLARQKNVWVGRDELKEQYGNTVTQVGSAEEAERFIRELYGWDSHTFTDRVLLYFLLEQKLSDAYGTPLELENAVRTETEKLAPARFFGK